MSSMESERGFKMGKAILKRLPDTDKVKDMREKLLQKDRNKKRS